MKFSTNSNTIIHKDQFDFMIKDLQQEFDKFMLINAVVDSYSINPCKLTKQRINTLKNPN